MQLDQVRRIATNIVREQAPELEVLGVSAAGRGSDYAEIFVGVRDCAAEPCRVTWGLDRAVSPEVMRAVLVDKLNNHRQDHSSR